MWYNILQIFCECTSFRNITYNIINSLAREKLLLSKKLLGAHVRVHECDVSRYISFETNFWRADSQMYSRQAERQNLRVYVWSSEAKSFGMPSHIRPLHTKLHRCSRLKISRYVVSHTILQNYGFSLSRCMTYLKIIMLYPHITGMHTLQLWSWRFLQSHL